MMQKLPIQDKILCIRQEKALIKFNQTEQNWYQQEQNIMKKCKKLPEQVLLNQLEQFRQKNEKIEAIELAKTDIERLGSRYWYLILRQDSNRFQNRNLNNKSSQNFNNFSQTSHFKTEQNEIQNTSFNNNKDEEEEDKFMNKTYFGKKVYEKNLNYPDAKSQFNSYLIYDPKKQVEIIKKPSQLYINNSCFQNRYNSKSRLSTYSTNFQTTLSSKFQNTGFSVRSHKSNLLNLLDDQLLKNSQYVDSKIVLQSQPDELVIQGQKKVDLELNSLQCDGEKDDFYYKLQKHPEQEAQEKQLQMLKNNTNKQLSALKFLKNKEFNQGQNKVITYDSLYNQDTIPFQYTNYQDKYDCSRSGSYFFSKYQNKLEKQQNNLAQKIFQTKQKEILKENQIQDFV